MTATAAKTAAKTITATSPKISLKQIAAATTKTRKTKTTVDAVSKNKKMKHNYGSRRN